MGLSLMTTTDKADQFLHLPTKALKEKYKAEHSHMRVRHLWPEEFSLWEDELSVFHQRDKQIWRKGIPQRQKSRSKDPKQGTGGSQGNKGPHGWSSEQGEQEIKEKGETDSVRSCRHSYWFAFHSKCSEKLLNCCVWEAKASICWRTSILFSPPVLHFALPPTVHKGSKSLHILAHTCLLFFDNSTSTLTWVI